MTKSDPGIYIIENTVNGKKYVGQAVNIDIRWKRHQCELKGGYHYNSHLQASWNKYGEESFIFQVLEYCSVDELNVREDFFITFYDSFKSGYNQTKGGEGMRGFAHTEETRRKISEKAMGNTRFLGRIHTDETLQRMSEVQKNRPPISEETRQRMSEAKSGRKHTDVARQRMSEGQKGRKHSDATRQKIGEAHKGKTVSDESRCRISEARKNRPPISEETRKRMSDSSKGRTFTEEHKRKISESSKKRWAAKKLADFADE